MAKKPPQGSYYDPRVARAKKERAERGPKGKPYNPKDADKNGLGEGSSTKKLTGGGVKSNPKTGVPTNSGFNANDPAMVKNVQRFLINRGYNIGPVDGVFGKLTKSAFDNWTVKPGENVNSRNPANWNLANPVPKAKGQDPVSTTMNSPKTNPPLPPGDVSASGQHTVTNPTLQAIDKLIQQIMGKTNVDYSGLADKQTNAEYDPVIDEATRQLGLSQKQKTQDTADIQNWFTGLIGQNRKGNEADAAALKDITGDSSGLLKNILGSLSDESAKTQVGKAALYNEGNLKELGAIEGNYNRNMDTALALRGRDEANRQSLRDTGAIDDAKAQLLQIIGQKGAALVGNRDKYRQEGLQNQTNLYNILASAALLPAQIDNAGLQSALTGAKITKYLTPTAAKSPKYDLTKLANQVAAMYGVQDDRRLPKNVNLQDVARTIGTVLRGVPNLAPGTPTYRNLGYQLLNGFYMPDGSRIAAPTNWFTGKG